MNILWKTIFFTLLGPSTFAIDTTIDAYYRNKDTSISNDSILNYGSTAILVCRTAGIPSAVQIVFQWTCPNGPCDIGEGMNQRSKTYNDTLVINILSEQDKGIYTCNIAFETVRHTVAFKLRVLAQHIMESYGRLIRPSMAITSFSDITPPGGDEGAINCTVTSGNASFQYLSGATWVTVSVDNNSSVHQITNGTRATLVLRNEESINNGEYRCRNMAIYIVLQPSGVRLASPTIQNITLKGLQSKKLSVTLGSEFHDCASDCKYILEYSRLDLLSNIAVTIRYATRNSRIIDGIIVQYGGRYRIRVWAYSIANKTLSSVPAEVCYSSTLERDPEPPRSVRVVGVMQNTIQLNWMPSKFPRGEIDYFITYKRLGTANSTVTIRNIKDLHYNLKGLTSGVYQFRMGAENLKDKNLQRLSSFSYQYVQFADLTGSDNSKEIIMAVGTLALMAWLITSAALVVAVICLKQTNKKLAKLQDNTSANNDNSIALGGNPSITKSNMYSGDGNSRKNKKVDTGIKDHQQPINEDADIYCSLTDLTGNSASEDEYAEIQGTNDTVKYQI